MKILVYDLPAESGGAITVLEKYYSRFLLDRENDYVLILGKYHLEEKKNVTVENYEWVKKSILHRLFFELFVAKRIAKRHKPDAILSLQNTRVFCGSNVPQTIYMHQSIPFCAIKFSFTKDFKLWFKQNVLGRYIIRSLKKCEKVIVQTQWIKRACVEKCNIPPSKIYVEPVIFDNNHLFTNVSSDYLFYPSGSNSYKNHVTLLKALLLFKRKHGFCPRLVLTLNIGGDRYSRRIFRFVKRYDLNVVFLGTISKEEVFEHYAHSILVFPSYLETFGLPLAEAKSMNCRILASDMPFSHEILDGYGKVRFFQYNDYESLSDLIGDCFKNNRDLT